jgi:TRAP-type C4-dicarboxylate transport system permease large subunit
MFSGWFTLTAAAAVASAYTLFLAFVLYRTLHLQQLRRHGRLGREAVE